MVTLFATQHRCQIEQLAAVFGFIRQTHYGRVFELLSPPQQRLSSECGGGESIFVDGFNAAEQLREYV
ncbi:MAG: hypothetical protein GY802_19320 [Gammaproteobacteria bacterium]|nr:hypothetical protein [Gammaproteobacteria bacterium]